MKVNRLFKMIGIIDIVLGVLIAAAGVAVFFYYDGHPYSLPLFMGGVFFVLVGVVALIANSIMLRVSMQARSLLSMAAHQPSPAEPSMREGNRAKTEGTKATDMIGANARLERSMRCRSCGAVSRVKPGEPAICQYCDSPLTLTE